MTSLQSQALRKNGLEQAARPFPNLNKITPENKKKIMRLAPPSAHTDNIHPMESASSADPDVTATKKRFCNTYFLTLNLLYYSSFSICLDFEMPPNMRFCMPVRRKVNSTKSRWYYFQSASWCLAPFTGFST